MCTDIYSDCGTNFIGASKILKKEINHELIQMRIKWHFNPPSAPHFGGLWEAGVKSVKTHLKRILRNQILTFKEMYTILCQIEACVNSRPLIPLTNISEDHSLITPGHFLIGRNILSVPEENSSKNVPIHQRWHFLQQIISSFWNVWSKEYLHTLQERHKWTTKSMNIQENDIVLIKNENTSPSLWPIARVIKIHSGRDELVRTVTVKTAYSEFIRPITKVCKLPISHDQ